MQGTKGLMRYQDHFLNYMPLGNRSDEAGVFNIKPLVELFFVLIQFPVPIVGIRKPPTCAQPMPPVVKFKYLVLCVLPCTFLLILQLALSRNKTQIAIISHSKPEM